MPSVSRTGTFANTKIEGADWQRNMRGHERFEELLQSSHERRHDFDAVLVAVTLTATPREMDLAFLASCDRREQILPVPRERAS